MSSVGIAFGLLIVLILALVIAWKIFPYTIAPLKYLTMAPWEILKMRITWVLLKAFGVVFLVVWALDEILGWHLFNK